MNPVQYYETTIQDNDSNLSAHVIVVPRRSLPESRVVLTGSMESETLEEPEYLMRQLGFWPIREINPDQIPLLLAALLSHVADLWGPITDTSFEAARYYNVTQILENPNAVPIPNADRAFAEYLSFERLIPFEQSPLDSLSLDQIAKASGVTIGAYIGFVVAGPTPLLFLTVPAGMIICGAAAGIGAGLQTGLRQRLSSLISRAGK
jgi:hypothetical protein